MAFGLSAVGLLRLMPDSWSFHTVQWCLGELVNMERCHCACCCHVQVLIDLKPVENGTLYDDFDMLPPKKIKVGVCMNVDYYMKLIRVGVWSGSACAGKANWEHMGSSSAVDTAFGQWFSSSSSACIWTCAGAVCHQWVHRHVVHYARHMASPVLRISLVLLAAKHPHLLAVTAADLPCLVLFTHCTPCRTPRP